MSTVRVLIAAAAALPASLSGQTIEWEQIWHQPNTATIYVDRASITGSGDLHSISTRTVYAGKLPEGYIAERIRTEEFDCKRHQSQIRQVEILAGDSRPPQVFDWSPADVEWSPVEPDSVGETKLAIACGISADVSR